MGAFIDDKLVPSDDTSLEKWFLSKTSASIVYRAFGSSSIISYGRVNDLISGLARFLFQTSGTSLFLALRNVNYETYEAVLRNLKENDLREILQNEDRVKIENRFVTQKWILQQTSVKIFLSHCGMNSIIETLYFSKPLLCMPFNVEQFSNASTIEHLTVGKSLFIPPTLFH